MLLTLSVHAGNILEISFTNGFFSIIFKYLIWAKDVVAENSFIQVMASVFKLQVALML